MPDEQHDRGWVANRGLTIAMAGLACVAVDLAMRGLHGSVDMRAFGVGVAVVSLVVLAGGELLRHRWPSVGATARSRVLWVCGGVAAAISLEAAGRAVAGNVPLLDAFLLIMLRDIVIALAILSHHADARPACVGFASFIVVFASASAHAIWAQGFVIAFAVIGVCWLVGSHWETLERRLEASSCRSLPRRWLLALPLAVLAVLAVVPVSARQMRQADGFMPTSGGQRDSSSAATSGVGDGDALVAGLDDIRSFAPLENAPFMMSHEPSMYDIYDDTYNEPVKKSKSERAISLANQVKARPEDHSMATSKRPGREFSTVRQGGTPSRRRIADLDSHAVLQVKGRVPVHLKLETFDRYDGVEWQPESPPSWQGGLSLKAAGKRNWLIVEPNGACDIYGEAETHALRIIRLDTNRIPATTRLAGIHIDHLDRTDFFRWARVGILEMDRDKLPELLTVHLRSQFVDPWTLTESFPRFSGGAEVYRFVGDDPQSQAVKVLAESWVAGVPRGWKQIERVVERIRGDYQLDPEARATPECSHSVAEFLLVTRRGPDYLFASAAVCALRSLGYAARMVSGFYADPRRYEARSDHTAVMAGDLHVWAEVHAGLGHWVPVEPTPGYVLLEPRRGLARHLAHAASEAWMAIVAHPFVFGTMILVVAVLVWHRRVLADMADEWLWRLRTAGGGTATAAQAVASAVFLLERRCGRAGLPRPPHFTRARWLSVLYERIAAAVPGAAAPSVALAFIEAADAAFYAPADAERISLSPVRAAPAVWSWRNLAAARRPSA